MTGQTAGAPAWLPEEARRFVEAAIVAGDMALPFHYPALHELEGWQSGFRWHGLTGENLVSTALGAWQPGWYVIALNGFDDPFFIDISEGALGFPVYHAPLGAGRWNATPVAAGIDRLGQMLSALRGLVDDDVAALRYLEAETDPANALWQEVLEARRAAPEQEEPARHGPVPGPEDLRHGTLVLTAVGPRKLEVVQFLRQVLDLSPREALSLIAEREIKVADGCLIQLLGIQRHLTDLGASVEFRPSKAS